MIEQDHWAMICAIAEKFGYSHLELRRVETYANGPTWVIGPRLGFWELQCKYPANDSQGVLRMETRFYGPDAFALLSAMIDKMPRDHTRSRHSGY